MSLRGAWATFRFEWRRSLRPARFIWWGLLAAFPLLLVVLMRSEEPGILSSREEAGVFVYVLVVRVICPLVLLLWAAPAVHSEIEGKTWTYVSVRPHGKEAMLLGKYAVAVAWASLVGFVAVFLTLVAVRPEGFVRLWLVLCQLALLSSIVYGAIYVLLGTLFLKRAMVVSVFYTLFVEVGLTLVPAVVNEATVDYRLRTLLVKELDLPVPGGGWGSLLSDGSSQLQAVVLLLYAAGFLALSLLVLGRRQLVVAEE